MLLKAKLMMMLTALFLPRTTPLDHNVLTISGGLQTRAGNVERGVPGEIEGDQDFASHTCPQGGASDRHAAHVQQDASEVK